MGDLSSSNLPVICNICDYIAKEFSKNYPLFKVSSDFKTNEHCEINGADLIIWNHLFKKSFIMRIKDEKNNLWVWLRIRDDWARYEPGLGFGERFVKVIDVELCEIYDAIAHHVNISIKGADGNTVRGIDDVNEIL